MKNKLFLLVLCFFLSASFVNAQDYIHTKKDTIKSKVVEIGLEEIKYKDFNNLDGPVYVIPKTSVIEIIYENGSKFTVTKDPYDANPAVEVRGKTHAIKFEFFSPLMNDIAFGYESVLKVGTNLEIKLGIIGPGFADYDENAGGLWLKGGIKFLKSPTFIQNGIKYAHPLHGSYIKPEIIINNYNADRSYTNYNTYPYTYTTERVNFTNLAVNIVFGRQSILGNVITIDYYVGLGYGGTLSDYESNSIYEEVEYNSYAYSHAYFDNGSPLLITGGLVIGYIY